MMTSRSRGWRSPTLMIIEAHKAFAMTWKDRDWQEFVRRRSERKVRERRARRGKRPVEICERMTGGGGSGEPHTLTWLKGMKRRGRMMVQVDGNRTQFIACSRMCLSATEVPLGALGMHPLLLLRCRCQNTSWPRASPLTGRP
jgi:hypothetical protein